MWSVCEFISKSISTRDADSQYQYSYDLYIYISELNVLRCVLWERV